MRAIPISRTDMWEYYNTKIVSPGVDAEFHNSQMKILGEDGWELCAVSFLDTTPGAYRMFFKRPKRPDLYGSGKPYR